MNAVFLVTKDKKQLAKVAVTGSGFVIGRSPQCELPLEEPLASRHHAEVVVERGAYFLKDRDSRNGTFVNGERIHERRRLADGDEVGIGTTNLKFLLDEGAGKAEEPGDDKTRFATFGEVEKKHLGQKVVAAGAKGPLRVKLQVVDGPLHGGVFRDWEGPLSIGRGLGNHVVLLDDAVSGSHARILRDGERYLIEDLNSANGTFVDGVKVQDRHQLRSGQKMKIGVSTLVFESVDLRVRRRRLKFALIAVSSLAVVAALVKVLQPRDLAGEHLAAAQGDVARDDLAQAEAEYALALQIDPARDGAKQGLARVRLEIDARAALTKAEGEAAAERYDKAKELCYRVLRDFPTMPRALELAAVIESIENARIAFDARNWGDARLLLQKAQETYPRSELIRQQLEQSGMELAAQQDLAQANDDIQRGQVDAAEPRLQSIPSQSVYFGAAKEQLDRIARYRLVASHFNAALASFRSGRLPEALAAIDAGLQQAPDNAALIELQGKVHRMEPLVGPLGRAESMSEPENVDALQEDHQTCQDVIAIDDHPSNDLRSRAQEADGRILKRLREIAQADVAKAADAVQAGDRRQALAFYDEAIKADSSDQDAAGRREKLFREIVADCQKWYQRGIVHEDLGQGDLAREAYKQVLAIGIPGEAYFKKASEKLETMGQ